MKLDNYLSFLNEQKLLNRGQVIYITSNGQCSNDILKNHNIKNHCHISLGNGGWNEWWVSESVLEFEEAFKTTATKLEFRNKEDYDKLESCDCVIVHGGDTNVLWKNIQKYNLGKYLKRVPIYVGISAGSYIVNKESVFICDGDEFKHNEYDVSMLGFVDIKFDVHFNNMVKNKTWRLNAVKVLERYSPFYFLSDGSYIKFEGSRVDYNGTIYKVEDGVWYVYDNKGFKKTDNKINH